jgi:TIR domain
MPPIEIFISYSHKDERWRAQLDTHLSGLRRQNVIDEWHDRCIGAGQEWAGAIDEHLNRAAVILLLISADFIASNYCYDLEMTRALERHDAGDARVIPVILRAVEWYGAPFGKLNALPKDGKPVKSWRDKDEAFAHIARGVRKVAEELRARPAPSPGAAGRSESQRLPPIWNVPFIRNPQFTGREALLEELHRKLAHGRAVLTAMAGFGKTQVALEYAYQHAHEFDLVWWLRSEEPTTLQEDYASLAVPLGLEQRRKRSSRSSCLQFGASSLDGLAGCSSSTTRLSRRGSRISCPKATATF